MLLATGVSSFGQAKKTTATKKKPSSTAASKKPGSKAKSSPSKRGRAKKGVVARGPTAPSPDRIREIQQALAASGHYRQGPNGRLDAPTTAALSSFQQANGLEPTGKLNARTLRKLEQFGLPHSSRNAPAVQAEIITQ